MTLAPRHGSIRLDTSLEMDSFEMGSAQIVQDSLRP